MGVTNRAAQAAHMWVRAGSTYYWELPLRLCQGDVQARSKLRLRLRPALVLQVAAQKSIDGLTIFR